MIKIVFCFFSFGLLTNTRAASLVSLNLNLCARFIIITHGQSSAKIFLRQRPDRKEIWDCVWLKHHLCQYISPFQLSKQTRINLHVSLISIRIASIYPRSVSALISRTWNWAKSTFELIAMLIVNFSHDIRLGTKEWNCSWFSTKFLASLRALRINSSLVDDKRFWKLFISIHCQKLVKKNAWAKLKNLDVRFRTFCISLGSRVFVLFALRSLNFITRANHSGDSTQKKVSLLNFFNNQM